MRKRNILTILGIAAAFVIAFGGWRLTNALLDSQEARLLSRKGTVPIVVQETAPSISSAMEEPDGITVDDGKSRTEFNGDSTHTDSLTELEPLSEEEIAAILADREDSEEYYPHEPLAGQLTMEEAVSTAQKAMSYLTDLGVIPSGSLASDSTDASLGVWTLSEENVTTINVRHSLWTVTLSEEATTARFTIHAFSGEIWDAIIEFPVADDYIQNWNAEDLLENFIYGLDIGEAKLINQPEENAAYGIFGKNLFYAISWYEYMQNENYGIKSIQLGTGLHTGGLNFE